jgi:hypothetical protein
MLRELPQPEFPADYIVVRLQVRKAMAAATIQAVLGGQADLPLTTDQEIAGQWQSERFWLYQQLNSYLRRELASVFLFYELGTLLNWLRVRQARGSDALLQFFLPHSLLCSEARKALREEGEAAVLAKRLEELFCLRLDPRFSGIAGVYNEKGLQGFERRLVQLFLETRGMSASQKSVRSFFRSLIDQRNVLALAKGHYWQEKVDFVTGGHLDMNWGQAAAEPARADMALARIHWQGGLPRGVTELSALEDFLLLRHRHYLHLQTPKGALEQILQYLWQQRILARNRGLLLHGWLVGNELLQAKVIL